MTLRARIAALSLLALVGCNQPASVRPPPRDSETLTPIASAPILTTATAFDARRDAVFAYVRDDGQTEIAEATVDGTARPLLAIDGAVLDLVSRADDDIALVIQGRGYLEPPETSDRLLRFDGTTTHDLGDRLLDALPVEGNVLLSIGPVDIDDAGRVVTVVSPRRDADRYYPGHFLCVLASDGDVCDRGPTDGAWQLVAAGAFTYARWGQRVQRRAAGDDLWEELPIRDVEDLVALTDGGVAILEQRPLGHHESVSVPRGTLHVLGADGEEVRQIAHFERLAGHRVEGGWELFKAFERESVSGGWSHHTSYRTVWTQLVVRRIEDTPIEVGHHDALEAELYAGGIVLADGSLRIETSDGVFVVAP